MVDESASSVPPAMAETVHYQHTSRVMLFARLINILFYWIALGLAELILAAVLNETMKVGGLEWIFPSITVILIGPVTWLSWRETDKYLYFGLVHEEAGATLHIKKIVHGNIQTALRFDNLQIIEWHRGIPGFPDLVVLLGTPADGERKVLLSDNEDPLKGFVIDPAAQKHLADIANTRATRQWRTLPTEPATVHLDATTGAAGAATAPVTRV